MADHRHLLDGKLVDYVLDPNTPQWVPAPEAIARIVIGNLLRNAAENSYEGTIVVTLEQGRLTVRDSGAGFDAVAAARRYSLSLRNSAKLGAARAWDCS